MIQRKMMTLFRFPHGLIRRYLSWFERLLTAAALAGLLFGLLHNLPAFPPYWDTVLVGAVFGITLWSPAAGYFLAVAAASYPLYTQISIYIMVLFLSIALLGQRVFIHNLGAVLLTAAAPWLAPFYLAWCAPLLGGLWWGAAGGAVMGGLAALWGQIVAGMAGQESDWLAHLSSSAPFAPQAAAITQRFAHADSLQTLKLLIEPLAPTSTLLLYHLLQVAAWTVVGGLTGALADRAWAQRRLPWSNILISWAAALALLVLLPAIPLWLGLAEWSDLAPAWLPLVFSAVLTALLASTLESLRDMLEHPLPAPSRRARRGEESAKALSSRDSAALNRERPSFKYSPSDSEAPSSKDEEDDDDLIMLDLD